MNKNELVDRLLFWFYEAKRDLPWRKNKNPYHIWVSEIMLQQTRVDTVKPYFERFISRFPDIETLSNATEDEVLKYWEGLGYYSRARNLLSAAREVQEKYGGKIPDDEERIRALKGIGPYTMGAILSIAYDKPVPAVDGNVLRVFSRIFAIEKDIAKTSTRKEIEDIVREIIPHSDPSGFNQALMELGALICLPRTPKCSICPVEHLCVAKKEGKEQNLPIKEKKESKKDIHLITVVFCLEDKFLIRQRLEENLLKNLWEFPSWQIDEKRQGFDFDISQFARELGMELEDVEYLGRVTHIFSHLRWNMAAYYATVESLVSDLPSMHYRWVTIEELQNYAFPVPYQKVMALANLVEKN